MQTNFNNTYCKTFLKTFFHVSEQSLTSCSLCIVLARGLASIVLHLKRFIRQNFRKHCPLREFASHATHVRLTIVYNMLHLLRLIMQEILRCKYILPCASVFSLVKRSSDVFFRYCITPLSFSEQFKFNSDVVSHRKLLQ